MSAPEDRPRVLLVVHPDGAGGGIATFTALLADRIGREVDVATVSYRRVYPRLTIPGRAERRRVVRPPGGVVPYLPWTWVRPLAQLIRLRPRLVVAQWWHPMLGPFLVTLSKVAHGCGARFAVVCHNAHPHERFPFAATFTRATLRSADVVWTLSDYVESDVRGMLPTADVTTLTHPPNVFDVGRPPTVALPARREAGPMLLFFGHVRPYKGLEDLLEALALVTAAPAPSLRVVGPFYESTTRIRQRVERLGLAGRVQLVDRYVPDAELPATFADVDLVVLPYRSASQSGVLTLAAHFGKPVVATDVGSIRADLAGTGRVVPPGDPGALARALDDAIVSPPPPPPAPGGWEPWVRAVAAVAALPVRTTVGRRRLARAAVAVVVACAAAVFARAVVDSDGRTWPGATAVLAALAALLAARATHITQWHLLLGGFSPGLRRRASARILTSAELARFVPGAVWHFAAGYRLATKAGVEAPAAVVTMCTDLALRLAGAFAVFLVTIAGWPHLSWWGVVAAVSGLAAAAALVRRGTVQFLAEALTRRRGGSGAAVDLPTPTLVKTAGLSLGGAALRGVAAAALVAGSVGGSGWRTVVTVIGAVALSWALGVLVPFAPAGLGIQEASGAALIALVVPAATAAATVIVLRLLSLTVEAVTAAAAYLADRTTLPQGGVSPDTGFPAVADSGVDDASTVVAR